jgi:hypothetical protein
MKKLLILFLVLCVTGVTSAATISLIAPAAGTPGASDDPLENGESLRVYIAVSDDTLDTYAATITAAGAGGAITGGISGGLEVEDHGVELQVTPTGWGGGTSKSGGWQSSLSAGSVVDSSTSIRQQLGMLGSTIHGATDVPVVLVSSYPENTGTAFAYYNTPISYIDITGDGSSTQGITLSIANGAGNLGSTSIETDLQTVPSFGQSITIYTVPEPMTIALLGLGGLLLRRRK